MRAVYRRPFVRIDRLRKTQKFVAMCFIVGCVLAFHGMLFAQTHSRQAGYRSANPRPVSPQVSPVPDFWDNAGIVPARISASDRLDRKNLPMLYHYAYETRYTDGLGQANTIAMAPSRYEKTALLSVKGSQKPLPDLMPQIPSLPDFTEELPEENAIVDNSDQELEALFREMQSSSKLLKSANAPKASPQLSVPESLLAPAPADLWRADDSQEDGMPPVVRLNQAVQISVGHMDAGHNRL